MHILVSMNSATTNTVVFMNGSKRASIRVTKHADGRVTAELSKSIVWRPIGGLRAAFNAQAKLEAQGYKVVSAA
jgi:hypothetical protein